MSGHEQVWPRGIEIAIASSGAGRVWRGIEVWATELAEHLHGAGVPVTLYQGGQARTSYQRHIPSISRNHPALRVIRGRLSWYRRLRIECLTFALLLVLVLRRRRVLLHVAEFYLASALLRLRSLGFWRGWVLLSAQTVLPDDLVRRVDAIQALTPDAAEKFRKIRRAGEGVTLVPNYVVVERFDQRRHEARVRLNIPPDRFIVLSVGAVERSYKRMDVLLREFAKLRSGGETLIIVGARETSSAEIIELARSFGPDVRVLLDVPHGELPQFYAAADCFALASAGETFGIVFLEAMASRLPIVAHDCPATRWIIGGGGRLVDTNRPGEMAVALRELHDSPELRARLAAAGHARVESLFSRERVLPEIIRLYAGVLEGGREE